MKFVCEALKRGCQHKRREKTEDGTGVDETYMCAVREDEEGRERGKWLSSERPRKPSLGARLWPFPLCLGDRKMWPVKRFLASGLPCFADLAAAQWRMKPAKNKHPTALLTCIAA